MILCTILLATIIVLAVATVTALAIGGAGFIIIFGDAIVCMLFIGWIIKRLIGRKKKK